MNSTNSPFLMMTSQMTIQQQQQQLPSISRIRGVWGDPDDKPNDHIDIKGKNELVPKQVRLKKRHILEKSTQTKLNENNHGHAYLPPFGIIGKG